MRIVSNFHDYYDVTMGLAPDEGDVVWERRTEELPFNEHEPLDHPWMPLFERLSLGSVGQSWVEKMHERIGADPGAVLVAGGVHPFLKADINGNKKIFWSFEDAQKWFSNHHRPLSDKRRSSHHRDRRSEAERVKAFFNDLASVDATDMMAEVGMPVGAMLRTGNYYGTGLIVHNPRLADVEFVRRSDPWTVYQNIRTFVEGRLRNPEPTMMALTEKDRVQQHGFDKWSFRRLPTKQR